MVKYSFGARAPSGLEWQGGKTAASIAFVNEAERYLNGATIIDETGKAKLKVEIDAIRTGTKVLTDYVTVEGFLKADGEYNPDEFNQEKFAAIKHDPKLRAQLLDLVHNKVTPDGTYGLGYAKVGDKKGIVVQHWDLPEGFEEIHTIEFNGAKIPVLIVKGYDSYPLKK